MEVRDLDGWTEDTEVSSGFGSTLDLPFQYGPGRTTGCPDQVSSLDRGLRRPNMDGPSPVRDPKSDRPTGPPSVSWRDSDKGFTWKYPSPGRLSYSR